MRATRKRVALFGVLLLVIALAIGWFPRRDSTAHPERRPPTTTVASTVPTATATDRRRLDAIERAARGRTAALPSLTLAGKVVDADGKPIAGAIVVLAAPHRVKVS